MTLRFFDPLINMRCRNSVFVFLLTLLIGVGASAQATAQSVCLPAPRLLTTMPMGGQAGEAVEVVISGQELDAASVLRFSDPRISAEAVVDEKGQPAPNRYLVRIADDCPVGIYEASVMTPLGLSAPRVFSVGDLPETTLTSPTTTIESASPLAIDSVCNATVAARAVNFHSFEAKQGQRYLIDCAAKGIDSKLQPVVIVADDSGRDLIAERLGGIVDFRPETDGRFYIKVHDLTFKGGSEFFYRLALTAVSDEAARTRMASTRSVNAFSWPPAGLGRKAETSEHEPNNVSSQAELISLPCDISGTFAPAADVDVFHFNAKKGDVWWIEIASERLGRPTDPSVVIQHLDDSGGEVQRTDVAELTDIPSPVKVSTNHYAYDGPPYNAGTSDVLGKLEISRDGLHEIRVTDLFGGTRNDPRNVYRMVIRKPQPDFAVVAWAMHMGLRNGDRNAVSKPISLRPGATMALEVVVIRRDGFDGPIDLQMSGLPDGMTATGLTIPAGKSDGIMLITADQGAPAGFASANFIATAEIDGQPVERTCHLASMAWPVTDHWSEIPSPRLLGDVPVSIGDREPAPITVTPREDKIVQAVQGTKITIPLLHLRHCEFSGTSISMKTVGAGFDRAPAFQLPLAEDSSELTYDLAALKTPPGRYTIALYGGAVAKYKADENKPPKDIADIVVSEPITIEVQPAP